tara:strand:- start:528 stop:737 length:210 start_codon:yes stop_codon:yes gene_type:complete
MGATRRAHDRENEAKEDGYLRLPLNPTAKSEEELAESIEHVLALLVHGVESVRKHVVSEHIFAAEKGSV